MDHSTCKAWGAIYGKQYLVLLKAFNRHKTPRSVVCIVASDTAPAIWTIRNFHASNRSGERSKMWCAAHPFLGLCWRLLAGGSSRTATRTGPRREDLIRRREIRSRAENSLPGHGGPDLSRQRSRVRVSSSPPFIPKQLGGFHSNHRGREKGTFCALFVPLIQRPAVSYPATSTPPSLSEAKTSDIKAACAACFAGVTACV